MILSNRHAIGVAASAWILLVLWISFAASRATNCGTWHTVYLDVRADPPRCLDTWDVAMAEFPGHASDRIAMVSVGTYEWRPRRLLIAPVRQGRCVVMEFGYAADLAGMFDHPPDQEVLRQWCRIVLRYCREHLNDCAEYRDPRLDALEISRTDFRTQRIFVGGAFWPGYVANACTLVCLAVIPWAFWPRTNQ